MTENQLKFFVEDIEKEKLKAQHLAETSSNYNYWLGVYDTNDRMLDKLRNSGIDVDKIIKEKARCS